MKHFIIVDVTVCNFRYKLHIWPKVSESVFFFPVTTTFIFEPGGGGGTHIFGRTGMCRSNGSLFYKKSLNMGPFFSENREIFEKWAYIT